MEATIATAQVDGDSADQTCDADDLRNLDEAARFFDISTVTLRRWIGDGCPVVEKGANGVSYKLSLRGIAKWRKDRDDADAAEAARKAEADTQLRLELGMDGLGDVAAASAGPMTPKQRADAIQAELARIKLAKEQGELVLFADVRAVLARTGQVVAASLRAMPDQLAAEFGWDEAVTVACQAKVAAVLADLADDLARLAAGEVNP